MVVCMGSGNDNMSLVVSNPTIVWVDDSIGMGFILRVNLTWVLTVKTWTVVQCPENMGISRVVFGPRWHNKEDCGNRGS